MNSATLRQENGTYLSPLTSETISPPHVWRLFAYLAGIGTRMVSARSAPRRLTTKPCTYHFGRFLTCLAGAAACINPAHASLIFSQDFSVSSDVAYYISSTPNSGQWNSINGGSIASGALSFTRGTTAESFTRSTDFSPTPAALIYKFDFNLTGQTTKATAAAVVQVGSGFSSAVNGSESATTVHSQFAINFTGTTDGYTFRDLKAAKDYTTQTFGGKFTLTWVINNSTTPVQYVAPDLSNRSVAVDHWDLWCGPYPIFIGSSAASPDQPLTDLKFAFTSGTGTVLLDNFRIEDISAVPEPDATGLLAAAFIWLVIVAGSARNTESGNRRKKRESEENLTGWSETPLRRPLGRALRPR